MWINGYQHQTTAQPTTFSSIQTNINELSKNSYLPLIGNGKFAIDPIESIDRRFWIFGKRILDVPVPYDPVVNIHPFGTHQQCRFCSLYLETLNLFSFKAAVVTRYRMGSVERCTCVNYGDGVINIHETFTAHRLIPTLFTQRIHINNPTVRFLLFSYFTILSFY